MKRRYINFDSGAGGEGGGGGETPLNFETVDAAVAALEKEHGLIIRNKEQEEQFLQNHGTGLINDKTRELYSSFDNEIERVSQVKRNEGEKTYDYLNRVLSTGNDREKQLSVQVDEMTQQIKKLQEDGGSAKEVETLNQQLNTLKDLHKTEMSKKDEEINKMIGAQFENQVKALINDGLAAHKPTYDKAQSAEIANAVEVAAVAKFNSKYKAVKTNDIIIWYDRATDKPMMDSKTGNAQGAATLIQPFLEPIIKIEKPQGGAGGDGGAGGAGGGNTEFVLSPPETVKTKTDLMTWMISEKGMDKNSKDFNSYYVATAKAKGIEKLI